MDLDEFDLLTDPLKITGAQPNAAFGFSLANAGDMNEDTYMDVFVGAPYHDDGQGAVFLYLGSADGLQTQYSQIIKPSSLNVLDGQKTFGWSISGGLDMDGNGYNDVAIGAYESGHATFIRSKSIIRVVPTLDFQFLKFNKTHQITSLQVSYGFYNLTLGLQMAMVSIGYPSHFKYHKIILYTTRQTILFYIGNHT